MVKPPRRSGATDIQKLDQFVIICAGLGDIAVVIEFFSEFRERNNHHGGVLLVTGNFATRVLTLTGGSPDRGENTGLPDTGQPGGCPA